ncbi:hypothetical protein PG988_002251 [Apiospora saccharicola]
MEEPRAGGGMVQPWKRLLSEIGPDSDTLDICIVSDRPWVRLKLAEEARINMAGPRQLRYPEYESYRRPDPFPQIYKAEKGYVPPDEEEEEDRQPFAENAWSDAMRKLDAMEE